MPQQYVQKRFLQSGAYILLLAVNYLTLAMAGIPVGFYSIICTCFFCYINKPKHHCLGDQFAFCPALHGFCVREFYASAVQHSNRILFHNAVFFVTVCANVFQKLVMKGNSKPSFNQNVHFNFTERELEVLKLICGEKTTAEIGQQLFLSPRSVEGVRQRLIEKVGVRNTAGLVMFAVKHDIL